MFAYLHNTVKMSLKKVLELIATESQGTLICAGDFNTVLNAKWDTSNNKRNVSPLSKSLRRVWVKAVYWMSGGTYILGNNTAPHRACSRIDYFLCSRMIDIGF